MTFFRFLAIGLLTGTVMADQAHAALPVHSQAPSFTLPASLGGNTFSFSLTDALKKGPVVLYFYPAAFTPGCTIEAHDFAEAMDQFHALGATVIGVSMDKIATLKKFSTSECRSRFAVAADTNGAVATQYDARTPDATYAARISYVITPDDRIIMSYEDRKSDKHVEKALAALQTWRQTHPE
ncbi:peroxiredoxin [Acetobacter conturbans]|uniref:thioredoxin-dependent peroxiredoxin n=1 Tax=Acetobacter conturbans TaxID=1737472 RepID=A0ABX0JVK1_9PROT|nr:peroxiredoxin [Acetobacter conturbans]NHN87299.1 redoxin domain-containing protein [Acetobacter conturbans]